MIIGTSPDRLRLTPKQIKPYGPQPSIYSDDARTISEWARIFDMPDGFVERVKRRVDEANERCCFGADNNPLIISRCWNEEVDR